MQLPCRASPWSKAGLPRGRGREVGPAAHRPAGLTVLRKRLSLRECLGRRSGAAWPPPGARGRLCSGLASGPQRAACGQRRCRRWSPAACGEARSRGTLLQGLFLNDLAAPVTAEAPLTPVAVSDPAAPAVPIPHAEVISVSCIALAARPLNAALAAPTVGTAAASVCRTTASSSTLSLTSPASIGARRAAATRTAIVPASTAPTALEHRHQLIQVNGAWHEPLAAVATRSL